MMLEQYFFQHFLAHEGGPGEQTFLEFQRSEDRIQVPLIFLGEKWNIWNSEKYILFIKLKSRKTEFDFLEDFFCFLISKLDEQVL